MHGLRNVFCTIYCMPVIIFFVLNETVFIQINKVFVWSKGGKNGAGWGRGTKENDDEPLPLCVLTGQRSRRLRGQKAVQVVVFETNELFCLYAKDAHRDGIHPNMTDKTVLLR